MLQKQKNQKINSFSFQTWFLPVLLGPLRKKLCLPRKNSTHTRRRSGCSAADAAGCGSGVAVGGAAGGRGGDGAAVSGAAGGGGAAVGGAAEGDTAVSDAVAEGDAAVGDAAVGVPGTRPQGALDPATDSHQSQSKST